MERISHIRVISTISIGLTVLVVGTIFLKALRDSDREAVINQSRISPQPTEDITSSPETEVKAVVTVPPSVTPLPEISSSQAASLASPSSLPNTAMVFLSNYYAAFSLRDVDRLGSMFSLDTTDEQNLEHSVLFTGKDLTGNVSGHRLFDGDPTISDYATGYSVLNSEKTVNGFDITILEQRVDHEGVAREPVNVVLQLIPSSNPPGSWLIDAYMKRSQIGKYNGFYRN